MKAIYQNIRGVFKHGILNVERPFNTYT